MHGKETGILINRVLLLITVVCYTDGVTLTGSAEYANPGSDFTLTCDVPEEAYAVTFYRRLDFSNTVIGEIQVGGDQCYNTRTTPPSLCTPDVCSCVPSSTGGRGTQFRWVIQPTTGDHESVWFCRRTNFDLPDPSRDSADYTLKVGEGPGGSISLFPPSTSYIGSEGYLLVNITCDADCRPNCTFVWTKPDHTNFTASAVLSLGHLNRSEQGTYRCLARNDIGEASVGVNITVLHLPDITIRPSADPYIVEEGQTGVSLECSVTDSNPPVTAISWRKGTTTVSTTGIYTLSPVSRSDAALYSCSATNSIGTTNVTLTLQVISLPRRPKIFGITNVSSSSLTLKWSSNDLDHSDNDITITYSQADHAVPEVMSFNVGNTRGIQYTTLKELKTNAQYCVNVTSRNLVNSSVSADMIAVTAPGISNDFTTCTSRDTSTVVVVVGAVLIVVAMIGFGLSVLFYRKGRILSRASSKQGIEQRPVKFSDISRQDTVPDNLGERSHYQDLDPEGIGKPSHYETTTAADAETNMLERGHYQELDPQDVGKQSAYETTVRVNTDIGSGSARDPYYQEQSTRQDYKNVTGKRDIKSTAVYSNT